MENPAHYCIQYSMFDNSGPLPLVFNRKRIFKPQSKRLGCFPYRRMEKRPIELTVGNFFRCLSSPSPSNYCIHEHRREADNYFHAPCCIVYTTLRYPGTSHSVLNADNRNFIFICKTALLSGKKQLVALANQLISLLQWVCILLNISFLHRSPSFK